MLTRLTRPADLSASLAIPAAVLAHLLASPHTKVEESFNIQAVHDIAAYGPAGLLGTGGDARYDHVDFPGAVPRTCVGALAVATLAKPFLMLVGSPLAAQVVGERVDLSDWWAS
jgi:alpha-1,6-mannosyltransferase